MDALVRTYLDRIGLRGPVKADLDTLRAVQRRTLETIPFENLDILRGIPLRFGTEELADKVLDKIPESRSRIVFRPLPADDPTLRQPDISLARKMLDWEPTIPLDRGLDKTIDYFRDKLGL